MKIDVGKGYGVYFTQRGDVLVIILCGGDKSTQSEDIKRAKAACVPAPDCPWMAHRLLDIKEYRGFVCLECYVCGIDAVPAAELRAYPAGSVSAWKPMCSATASNASIMDGVTFLVTRRKTPGAG